MEIYSMSMSEWVAEELIDQRVGCCQAGESSQWYPHPENMRSIKKPSRTTLAPTPNQRMEDGAHSSGPADELREAREELQRLIYSVSHDLRAPLRAVGGFADILQQRFAAQMPEPARGLLQQVCAGAGEMAALLEGLLSLSRLGEQPLVKQRVDVSSVVLEVWAELRATSGTRRVQMRVVRLPEIDADPTALRQVFTHLMANALKFTRTKKTAVITVGGRSRGGETIYYVRDNGVGFDLRYAGKLFGVFQRLHATEEFEGTGVGLPSVKRLITRQGGRVWAEAQVGRGATFYFSLPNGAADEPGARLHRKESSTPPESKLRVLLLEDNLADRELIRARLQMENLPCELVCAGGRKGFEAALAQGDYAVVLSDYALPQFDGLGALRLVRARHPDLPFILISGQLGEEQAVECVKLGATDYVLKHNLARLGSVIRRALREAEASAMQRRADETVRELSRRLLRFQDEGRRQIARELHDSVAQNLMALGINLGSAQRLVPPSAKPLKLLLADCAQLSDETAQALRTVSYLLHPPALDALGLPGALSDYVAGFSRRSGIKVTLKIPAKFGRLPDEMETALYRIVQEGLTNIHRHSGSATARITLHRNRATVGLEIADDGRGLPIAPLHHPPVSGSLGVGIAGMRERLQLLGGRLEVESSSSGTRVRAVLSNPLIA